MKKILTLLAALIVTGSMMVVHADTWTPAGIPADVFGSEWAPENAANDMTLSNGLYVFAKSITYSGNISFKVVKNHAWGTEYPGSDYSFDIPAGSEYLIITYKDDNTHAVNAYAISSMTVAGDNGTLFGSTWSPSTAANDMTLDGGVYKFEKSGVALSAGTINFKACANHSWDNAWPSSDYSLSIPESGNYTITITFNPATLAVNATAELEQAVVVIPTIELHSNITNPSWETSTAFIKAANDETASLTLTGVTKGDYLFGVKIDGTWTSNGSAFTRTNNSFDLKAAGSGNCSFNADRNGDYTFTWTFATNTLEITYPAIPAQSVAFNGLNAQILKGTAVNLANCVTPSGIESPGYIFYIKEKNGSYGSAIDASYTFNTLGEFVVKVDVLENNTGDPVASDEANVAVYDAYTFTNGSTIYVDFSAMTEGAKGVNYPKVNEVGMDWDGNGAGSIKEITFSADVEWTTNDVFIKTEKDGWAEQKFIVPSSGQNIVKVAADGASFSWDTYVAPNPVYTVAGSASAFGSNWDINDAANEMTLDEGVYKLEKTGLALSEGKIEFKVVKDHAYGNGSWPASNYELTILSDGIYTIEIIFDPSNTGNEVSASSLKTGEAVIIPTVAAKGSWDDWANEVSFTLAANELSASGTIHLNAGSYNFKMLIGGDYRSNGWRYHRGFTGTEGITGNSDENMLLETDIEGDVTITWTFATNAISIEFPELTWSEIRSGLAAERYYTVCWPKKMLYVRGASVWSFAGKDASMAYLVKEEGALDAGKPYIIYAEGAKFEAVLVGDEAAAGSNNGLYGTLSNMTNADLLAAGATYMLKDNQLHPVGGGHLDANRAYVILDNITGGKPAGMPAHKVRGIPMQRDAATGIEDVQGDNIQCTKMMIDGQLFIIRGENMFDATGRLVK